VEVVPFPVVFVARIVILRKILGVEFEPVDASLIPPQPRKY